MDHLPFRQVHLDFHTSECMPGVGSEFSEENFENALKIGHISSITLFAKCHHGWMYYPSNAGKMHPTLKTDLLSRQLAVCKKLGVRAQIYISAGFDERRSVEYPQFRNVRRGCENSGLSACFHGLCLNNDEYLEMLCAEVREVVERYNGMFDGVFMDICFPSPCICDRCIDTMLKLGLNPESPEDVEKHRLIVYEKYTGAVNRTVAGINPDMPVFHNCGDIPRNDRKRVFYNTHHVELESLPTGGWGYDHFPLSAAYMRVLDREFSGMTGKFHKSWGEFGGYKHPNALIYETALSLANGAKCCVGDQLHPLGHFDEATYSLIGKAYAEVEKKEAWCHDVRAVADIAIYSTHADGRSPSDEIGANRILLEGKYLYNIIDSECNLSDYKLVIFPDSVIFDEVLSKKVNDYIAKGGKILLSGKSGTDCNGSFFKDFGLEFQGENGFNATYLVPNYDMQPNGIAAYFMYKRGYLVKKTSEAARETAFMQNSYFNRELRRFCSHANTPNNPESRLFGAGISGSIGYIGWSIFTEYAENGAYHAKRIVTDMLDELLCGVKTLETSLPSNGVTTLMYQECEKRYVNHLLYTVTKKRGDTEVIEDAIPVYETSVTVRLSERPERVYLAPERIDLPFTYEEGVLRYTVPKFTTHTMAVIEMK